MKIADTFTAGQEHLDELLRRQPVAEPTYEVPKRWPHQVPEHRRRRSGGGAALATHRVDPGHS